MKNTTWWPPLVVAVIAALMLAGCESIPKQHVADSPGFRDDSKANLVVQFYKWDSFTVNRPTFREGGFVRVFTRDHLAEIFARPGLQRDLAVVVIGFSYDKDELKSVVADWTKILSEQGYHRVVCLRAAMQDSLNGLTVLGDTRAAAQGTAGF